MSEEFKKEIPLQKLSEIKAKLDDAFECRVSFSNDVNKMKEQAFTEMRQRVWEAREMLKALWPGCL